MAKQQKHNPVAAKKKTQPSQGSNVFTYLLRNLVVVIAAAILLTGVYRIGSVPYKMREIVDEYEKLPRSSESEQRAKELADEYKELQSDTGFIKKTIRQYIHGYYWASHDVALKGSENVKEIKDKAGKPLTREDKFAMRVGIWPYIDYIVKNTPKDAVIYLPEGDSILANDNRWNWIYHAGWMEYFLYPRLCVTVGLEKEYGNLAQKLTHVVILNGKGYERLRYEVPMEQRSREPIVVLPINRPETKTQP